MARKAMILKAEKKPKYSTRLVRRCKVCGRARGYMGKFAMCRVCGRARGYMGKFAMCRVCFRKYASDGLIPGVTKSSW